MKVDVHISGVQPRQLPFRPRLQAHEYGEDGFCSRDSVSCCDTLKNAFPEEGRNYKANKGVDREGNLQQSSTVGVLCHCRERETCRVALNSAKGTSALSR